MCKARRYRIEPFTIKLDSVINRKENYNVLILNELPSKNTFRASYSVSSSDHRFSLFSVDALWLLFNLKKNSKNSYQLLMFFKLYIKKFFKHHTVFLTEIAKFLKSITQLNERSTSKLLELMKNNGNIRIKKFQILYLLFTKKISFVYYYQRLPPVEEHK